MGAIYPLAGAATEGVYAYGYDAWNRLVKVTKAWRTGNVPAGSLNEGSVVQESEYDGLGRRIVKAVQNSAELDATYHYYYSGHSIVEVRNGSDATLKQYVWGGASGGYVDELVQTSINDDPADGSEQVCESSYWAMQDANFNVLGVVDASGGLKERYEYTPYGERTVFFSPGSNDPLAYSATRTSRRVSIGGSSQPYGLLEMGHQGLYHDEETGLVYNRDRTREPIVGRWLQREPGGYLDGMSLYQYVRSRPTYGFDPSGWAMIGPEDPGWEGPGNGTGEEPSKPVPPVTGGVYDPLLHDETLTLEQCRKLLNKIIEVTNGYYNRKQRYNPWSAAKKWSHRKQGWATPQGHYQAVVDKQRQLEKLVNRYKDKCPPPNCPVTEEVPERTERALREQIISPQVAWQILFGGGGARPYPEPPVIVPIPVPVPTPVPQ